MSATKTTLLSPLPLSAHQSIIKSANGLPVGVTVYLQDLGAIVARVNAHDDLVAALHAVREFWAGGDAPAELMAQIDAALDKAEGKS
jgi:hypothetical protein